MDAMRWALRLRISSACGNNSCCTISSCIKAKFFLNKLKCLRMKDSFPGSEEMPHVRMHRRVNLSVSLNKYLQKVKRGRSEMKSIGKKNYITMTINKKPNLRQPGTKVLNVIPSDVLHNAVQQVQCWQLLITGYLHDTLQIRYPEKKANLIS